MTDWKGHVEAWEASGLSQAAYSRLHGLSAAYLSQRVRARRKALAGKPVLIPVRVEPAWASPPSEGAAVPSVVLHWGEGQRLEIPAAVSPRWLAELLQCLG